MAQMIGIFLLAFWAALATILWLFERGYARECLQASKDNADSFNRQCAKTGDALGLVQAQGKAIEELKKTEVGLRKAIKDATQYLEFAKKDNAELQKSLESAEAKYQTCNAALQMESKVLSEIEGANSRLATAYDLVAAERDFANEELEKTREQMMLGKLSKKGLPKMFSKRKVKRGSIKRKKA